MKRILMLIGAACLVFAMAACSDTSASESTKKDVSKHEKKEPKKNISKDQGNGKTIDKVGDVVNDPTVGKVKGTDIVKINKTIKQGGIKIHLIDAKILSVDDMTDEFENEVSDYLSDEGNYVYAQITYDVENTTDKQLLWDGFETAVIDGEQKDLADYAMMSTNPKDPEIQPNAMEKGNLIAIPVDSGVGSIRLQSSDVLKDSPDDDDAVVHGKEFEIKF